MSPCFCGEDTCALVEECCFHSGMPCGEGCLTGFYDESGAEDLDPDEVPL